VRLLGALTQDELRLQYQAARVVAVPSVVAPDGDRDGVPNVLLEGLAAGCPVAASRAGAIAEAIEDGVNGLLVPSGDAQALAAALKRLLEDAGLRARLRAAGHTTLTRDFDAARNAAALAHRLTAAMQVGERQTP
jgi:glycosyltransferase involved in cell wall biosynthesis